MPRIKKAAVAKRLRTTAKKSVSIEERETVFAIEAPHAQQVSVCGEFNDWKPGANPMQPAGDGQWKTKLALPMGRYQYKYVVDEQWCYDPDAPEAMPDGHGSLNSVVEVH